MIFEWVDDSLNQVNVPVRTETALLWCLADVVRKICSTYVIITPFQHEIRDQRHLSSCRVSWRMKYQTCVIKIFLCSFCVFLFFLLNPIPAISYYSTSPSRCQSTEKGCSTNRILPQTPPQPSNARTTSTWLHRFTDETEGNPTEKKNTKYFLYRNTS